MKLFHIDSNHDRKLNINEKNNKNIDILLQEKLNKHKETISNYKSKWDIYKKNTNLYEYVYTSNKTLNICNVSPISRSYFKIHEILHDLNILDDLQNISITCIAEAPGGFIENILYNCENNHIDIKNIYGITLKQESSPYWNTKILTNKSIKLLYGLDNTGDICNINNLNDFIDKIKKNTCDLITSDGGIDYSNDYNNQEQDSYRFIYSEILLALCIQKPGGTFILKVFDLFDYKSIQLLYLLYLTYSDIYIHKPHTSRNTNSEKYIVCKNYLKKDNIVELLKSNYNKELCIYIPVSYIKNINIYNYMYVSNQIKYITNTINNIKNNTKINKPSNFQVEKSIEWCLKYKLQINKYFIDSNKSFYRH